MKYDTYTLVARLFPAILTSIPYFILQYYVFRPQINEFWQDLLAVSIASDISISFIFLYLHGQISRIVSKVIFEDRIYKKGLDFPTTRCLLHSDQQYSTQYLAKIHKKIKQDYGLVIPRKQDELLDEKTSRKCICEAISHIRATVGKGDLTGQHNLEYGFIRNLAGGTLIASMISIVNCLIFMFIMPNFVALSVSLSALMIYLLLIVNATKLINIVGYSYAKVLIQEYMQRN